jgi:cephalosporin hydroxylase
MNTDVANNLSHIRAMQGDPEVSDLRRELLEKCVDYRYAHNFTWLGRPIIQLPQDVLALQEIIWRVQPDLIVETGVAHGGSLVFYASLLELIGHGEVLGIDIDIRAPNRRAIGACPVARRITLLEGSSVSEPVVSRVREAAAGKRVMVALDSNHTHEHVLRELHLYSPLVSRGSYLVVFDTVIEELRTDAFPDRPWGRGNNPMTAVKAFLGQTDRFEVDDDLTGRLLLTACPGGYLRCVKD